MKLSNKYQSFVQKKAVVCFLFTVTVVASVWVTAYAGQKKISRTVQAQHVVFHTSAAQTQPRSSIRILAAMVEFQKDSVSQTSGDGTFTKESSVQKMIDPAPHDTSYFRNKMKFVTNYFQKVSKGRLSITGDILNHVTLTKKMSEYSPPTNSTNNKKLAQLATEAWQAVSDSFPALNFSQYDAFVIFHAGCGRDIDLVSLLGYNPTPYDIPSLYLDSTAFATALDTSTFSGIAVRGGKIKTTMILPETETQIFSTSLGNDTLQLSTNGLFAASIGSYLGLPDLFNTKTGASGIGEFGLMDGASFFAYNGVFPPEPSAWEKIYLGWTTPIVLSTDSTNVLLPAVGSTNIGGQDTIYKIPITSSEYFLVENRNRDPKQNGQHIKSVVGTDTLNFSFSTDTAGFNYSEIYDLHGSIIDVEDYDWALMGYHDNATTQYDGGGILIWHIDENVIAANLATNTVNANEDHRGVDLEEADGSQDIGQSYESLTARSGTEYGSPLDCWFYGNPATVYTNVFSQTTFPNSKSYSGAASLVTMKDFSARSARMTMTVKFGNTSFNRLPNFTHTLATATQTGFPTTTSTAVILPVDNRVYIWGNDGRSKISDTTGLFSTTGGQLGVAAYEISTSQLKLAGVQDTLLYVWNVAISNGMQTVTIDTTIQMGTKAATAPVFVPAPLSLYVGGANGKLYQYRLDTKLLTARTLGTSAVTTISQLSGDVFCVSGSVLYKNHNSVNDSISLPSGVSSWLLASAVSNGGNYVIVAQNDGNSILAYDQTLSKILFDVQLNNATIGSLATGDVNGDGEKDVVVTSAKSIYAFNRHGVLLDNFPVSVSRDSQFVGAPILGDVDGDGATDILALASDGTLSAWNNRGKLLTDYPVVAASPGTASLAALKDSAGQVAVFTATRTGYTQATDLGYSYTTAKLYWTQQFGNALLSSADSTILAVTPTSTSELISKSHTYNWPNPVYGNSTQIRYYVNENSAVNIKIFDLAGSKITELTGNGIANFDNEVTWNVSSIQSGIYLARVEATSASKSAVAIIKIAVVK
jgi:hypothetical protein